MKKMTKLLNEPVQTFLSKNSETKRKEKQFGF